MRKVYAAVLGVAVAAGAQAALAGSQVLELRMTVPEVCWAEHAGAEAPEGARDAALGVVDTLCNASVQRPIYATHPGGDAAAGVAFVFDGAVVPADRSGRTLLRRLDGPERGARTLAMTSNQPLTAAFPVTVAMDGARSVGTGDATETTTENADVTLASVATATPPRGDRNSTLVSYGGGGLFRLWNP